jgi:hypothetical protein
MVEWAGILVVGSGDARSARNGSESGRTQKGNKVGDYFFCYRSGREGLSISIVGMETFERLLPGVRVNLVGIWTLAASSAFFPTQQKHNEIAP